MVLEQRSYRRSSFTTEPQAVVASTNVTLSGPMPLDLTVYRGDTGKFRVTVKNEDNSPADLTGATWDADIRSAAGNPIALTAFEVIPVAGDPSSVDVVLDKVNANLLTPGVLYYDVEMTLADEIVTLVAGKLTVTQDVSRTP